MGKLDSADNLINSALEYATNGKGMINDLEESKIAQEYYEKNKGMLLPMGKYKSSFPYCVKIAFIDGYIEGVKYARKIINNK